MPSATGAEISGPYRYRLWRHWGEGSRVLLWIMLNPSTADADVNDPTIRKCIGFSKRDGFDGLMVCNLYAWRGSNPDVLLHLPAPVGVGNDDTIIAEALKAASVVVAWGRVHKRLIHRPGRLLDLLQNFRPLCLGKNGDGSPKHPLYLAKNTPLVPF